MKQHDFHHFQHHFRLLAPQQLGKERIGGTTIRRAGGRRRRRGRSSARVPATKRLPQGLDQVRGTLGMYQREIWGRNIRVKPSLKHRPQIAMVRVPSIWEISVHDFVANLLMVLVVNTFPLKNSSATKYSDEWFVDAFGKFPNDTVIPFTGVLRTIH